MSEFAEILAKPMPALFLGHGSPMNAIEENEFVEGFRTIAREMPLPKAVLCISAHWETRGSYVTTAPHPATIYDFGGFPKALYEVHYPAPGSPALASVVRAGIRQTSVLADENRGLDHGCWSVLKHLYPEANVPVVQLSLDYLKTPQEHFALAQDLKVLRQRGILILGSGNLVHNLRLLDWNNMNTDNFAFDWAKEASEVVKRFIREGNVDALCNITGMGKAYSLAVPTPEHFLPLLYVLAVKDLDEPIRFFNDKAVGGSLTMTSLIVG